jgi:hypothetical protein
VSPSEIAFLALGLVLGTAVGAALVQLTRARPAPRREIRLTITPNAIPARRAQTLALAYGAAYPGLIPGSPEDTTLDDRPGPGPARWPSATPSPAPDGPGSRTRVPTPPYVLPVTAIGVPVGEPASGPRAESPNGSSGPRASAAGSLTAATAVAVLAQPAEEDATAPSAGVAVPATTLRPRPERPGRDDTFTTLARSRPPAAEVRPTLPPHAMPVAAALAVAAAADRPPADAMPAPEPAATPATAAPAAGPETSTGPCAGLRRMVDERCALADVAREQARRAADALREGQRAYDVLRERVDRAEDTADPRRIAAEKERLHAAFRAASERAGTPDETEAAARAWLTEVNTLNAAVREAGRIIESGNAELRAQLPALERLSAEADAARIAAENAEVGCRDARQELAACEEAETRAREAIPPPAEEPHPFAHIWPMDSPNLQDTPAEPSAAAMTGLPVIVRVLRGEREARDRVIAALAAGDADAERDWGLRISRFLDAIMSRAIEDGYLDLPEDDPFWRLFDRREARDIVGALSALGFRYDGLGGFADGRVPAARDLSLAVGYAGLDRMRIRTWPGEADLSRLYGRAVVAADEWLVDQAGDLSLGRMVDALGARASDLTEVWNAWGRVRPVLLAP